MSVRAFLQGDDSGANTVSELRRVHGLVGSSTLFGCYAYATQSGAAAFDLNFGTQFWEETDTKWLFGLDYGRTEPTALQFIAGKPRTEVRIHDGQWVVDSPEFLPRRDYHMKSAFFVNQTDNRFGMVVGSGNFSANGLSAAVECGNSLIATSQDEFQETFQAAFGATQTLWDGAVPLEEVFVAYHDRWVARGGAEATADEELEFEAIETFWIEAGYVTRNRGPVRPGNQIDMPRGMNRYFGFNAPADLPVNSVIGPITFAPVNGEPVTNNLRLGNNHMEKVSLPIPETHGFDIYDGKVLIFHTEGGGQFRMWALESADFDIAFAGRIAGTKTMASGRRFGYIV